MQLAIHQMFNFTPPICEGRAAAAKRLFAALFLVFICLPVAAGESWESYYDQAEAYYGAQDYLSAERSALAAMTQVENLQKSSANPSEDYSIAEADCANLLALIYVRLAYFDRAAEYALRCNEIDRASGDADNIASSYNTLAGIYMAANEPEKAETSIRQALSYCAQVNNPPRMAVPCAR